MKKLLLATLLLTACSSIGPTYQENMLNGASIVVYRQAGIAGVGGWDVEFNGILACDLHGDSFFRKSVKPGIVNIASSLWGEPGTSRISVEAKPNQITFIRISPDNSKVASAMAAGMIGRLLMEGVSSTGGPFIFTQMPSKEAKEELEGLHLEESCI